MLDKVPTRRVFSAQPLISPVRSDRHFWPNKIKPFRGPWGREVHGPTNRGGHLLHLDTLDLYSFAFVPAKSFK